MFCASVSLSECAIQIGCAQLLVMRSRVAGVVGGDGDVGGGGGDAVAAAVLGAPAASVGGAEADEVAAVELAAVEIVELERLPRAGDVACGVDGAAAAILRADEPAADGRAQRDGARARRRDGDH